jgi:DNA-binding MarR family transcriptional regulator
MGKETEAMFESARYVLPLHIPADLPLGLSLHEWRVLCAIDTRLRTGQTMNTVVIGMSAGVATTAVGPVCRSLAERGLIRITGWAKSRQYEITEEGWAAIDLGQDGGV